MSTPNEILVATQTVAVRLRATAALLRAFLAKESLAQAASVFQDDTDDYTPDPRYAVPVSRFGTARPPVQRDMIIDHIPRRESNGTVQWDEVRRVKDQIDRMYEAGQIGDDAYKAARLFHSEFSKCGYESCRTTNLAGTSGGGMGIEDVYTRSCRARDYVHSVLKLLGGGETDGARVVCWYVGFMYNMQTVSVLDRDLRTHANQKGRNRHYLSGVLHASLQIMGDDYKRMMRGKPRKSAIVGMPAQGLVTPKENRY